MTPEAESGPHDRAAGAGRQGLPVEAQYVRQGRISGRIVLVLFASFLLAAAALAWVWWSQAGDMARLKPEALDDARATRSAVGPPREKPGDPRSAPTAQ